MTDCRIELDAPAYLVLVANGQEHRVDPYAASRRIAEIGVEHESDLNAQWVAVRHLLAESLGVDVSLVAENQARQFHDTVNALVAKLDEQQKKTSETIASWRPATPASPATSENGQPTVSVHGSETWVT
jgi:hypothetical protein